MKSNGIILGLIKTAFLIPVSATDGSASFSLLPFLLPGAFIAKLLLQPLPAAADSR